MKIDLTFREDSARTELAFESGPYDAILPVSGFFMAHRLRYVHADRLAIACVLLLGRFLSGPLVLPRPCSPEIAKGLEEFLAPLDVRIETVEHRPFAKPIGSRTALLLPPADAPDAPVSAPDQPHDITFRLSGTQQYQSRIEVDAIELCCNLRALAPDDPMAMGQALLGLAILCAEDMAVFRVLCPPNVADSLENFDILARTAAFSNVLINV